MVFTAIRAGMVSAGGTVAKPAAWEAWLRVIGSQVVDDRPNRSEPGVRKLRPKDGEDMTKPRHQYPRSTRSTA